MSLLSSAALRSSFMSMLPCLSVPMILIVMPAMIALAGLVPCALLGMMHTLRCLSPLRQRVMLLKH